MRMHLPNIIIRRQVYRHLAEHYANLDSRGITKAITILSRYYRVRRPRRIEWYEYIDRGRTWALLYEDGTMHVVHPENWKSTPREWIKTVLHEWKHYLYWFEMEKKADKYAEQMVRGCDGSFMGKGF